MQQYLDLYNKAHNLLCQHSAPLMNEARDQAYQLLTAQTPNPPTTPLNQKDGTPPPTIPHFPTRRDEAYRYTDVAAAFAPDYGLNLARIDIPVNPYEAFRCDVPNLSTSVYFVINDAFHTRNLPTAPLPPGVIIDSLRTIATQHPEWLKDKYSTTIATTNQHSATNQHPTPTAAIPLLNTLLAQDGIYIRIPDGVRLERPLQIVNILRSDVELMVNRRVLIDIGDGAEAAILICDHTADNRPFLVTEVSEVFTGANATLQLYTLEENAPQVQRFTHLNVRQQAHSAFTHTAMTLSAGLSCNRVNVTMQGEGANATLNGAVIADGQQHIDHATLITHDAPGCHSSQLYKYVLDDHATGAFTGRILVPHDMQRTTSDMVNANLISAPTARIYTQPMLEIYADDVQCSHGSTVGQLSDDALIYMRQRGIPESEARLLLKQAFASQVIESIQIPTLRDRLHHLVEKRFRQELTHCASCQLCKK